MTKTTSCRSPPLDPYVRLSPHTAHERGILRERSISPAPRCMLHGQLCAFAGYLCTVSRPSPSGPSPSVLVLGACPRIRLGQNLTSQNAPESTIGDLGGVLLPPKIPSFAFLGQAPRIRAGQCW